jgi:3-methyladenine DNA glycosylase AlkD
VRENSNQLASEIQAWCAAHADAKEALRYARYFKEGYDAWGFMGDKDHPTWTVKEPEWLEKHRGLGLGGFLKLGDTLFASGKYEEGALAIRFAAKFLDQFDEKSVQRLGKWFEAGIGNWAHTDTLCALILAPLLQKGQVSMEALAGWRESALKYQRRAVPVAMLGLVKEGKAAGPMLKFARPLMLDPERVVHQGVGWFLRELWKKQPQPVETFLTEWKDQAPRLIFQYATEKMSAAQKARYRRAPAPRKTRTPR